MAAHNTSQLADVVKDAENLAPPLSPSTGLLDARLAQAAGRPSRDAAAGQLRLPFDLG